LDEPKVTGLDIGTSKIKMYVYDESLVPIKKYEVRNTTYFRGPVAEQDPSKLLLVTRELIEKSVKLGSRIIGLSTYRGSLVVWTKEKKPVSPIVTWMDLRSTINYNKLPMKARIMGKLPVIGPALSPESLGTRLKTYLIENPSLAEKLSEGKAYAWNIDSYLIYMLTGKYVADPSTAALTGLINPRTLKPLGIVFNLLDLPKIQLPELVMHDMLNVATIDGQAVIGG
jgi:glycerol kinase